MWSHLLNYNTQQKGVDTHLFLERVTKLPPYPFIPSPKK